MEVEFEWVVVVCKPIFISNLAQLSQVEVVLRLSWGCDNFFCSSCCERGKTKSTPNLKLKLGLWTGV